MLSVPSEYWPDRVPFDKAENLQTGMPVIRKGHGLTIPTGRNLLGRSFDRSPHQPQRAISEKLSA